MSYYILNINTEELDNKKILIGKQIKVHDNKFRYYLYYMDNKPKNIFINLPSSRLLFNYENNKYDQIKIPIYPLWDQNKKFIKFIKKIEKYIKEKININKIFISCLNKIDNITYIKLNMGNNLKIISSNTITIKDFKINGEIEGIINLNYVWEKELNYGLSINIYQLKYISNDINIDFYKNELIEDIKLETNNNTSFNSNIIEKKVPLLQNIINPEILVKNKPLFQLSPNLLNEALLKLNKIKIN